MGEKQKARPKLKDIPIEAHDLDAILDMSIRSVKLGRSPKFTDDAAGLAEFREASIAYLDHVKKTNDNPGNENKLIPDIESWAAYLGTTRKTILEYEKGRNEEWRDFILQMKNIITACKKQLAFRQKIPTLLAVFDLTNNSDYVNTSEFKLKPDVTDSKQALTAAELPKLGQVDYEKENTGALSANKLPKID